MSVNQEAGKIVDGPSRFFWSVGPCEIDHFAIFALAQNEVTMKYVFWGEKAWSSSALLLISTS